MREVALGIDLGTTAVKVGAFDVASGRPVAVSAQPHELSTPQPDWVELEAETYWDCTVRGVRDVMRRAGRDAQAVSVGLASQGQTFVVLDAQRRPLRPAIVWIDTRARAELEEFARAVDHSRFYRNTGVPFPNVIDSAPKILWVKRHEPEVFAAARHIIVLPAFIALRLTGEPVADPGNAGSTGLLDEGTLGWWPEAVAAVGVDPALLGRVAPSGSAIGGLSPEAAQELGLPEGIPVGTGANDQSSAAVAMGNRQPGQLSATIGTAMAVVGTVEPTEEAYSAGLLVGRHPLGDALSVLAYAKTAAILLTWFRRAFGVEESYEDLTHEAAHAPVGCDGLTCIPHMTGMGTPSFDDGVRGAFLNVGLQHQRRHFLRAMVEAVCFGARDSVEQMRGVGAAFGDLIVSGGATQSPSWMQAMADCLQLPVRVPECAEAACRGGALLGLIAAGRRAEALAWPASEAGLEQRYAPDAGQAPGYDEAYGRYVSAMDTLYPGARSARP